MNCSTSFSNSPAGLALALFLLLQSVFAAATGQAAEPAAVRQVAVFPVENLTGRVSPLKDIRTALREGLAARGFRALDDGSLNSFMARHRVRYVGGIDKATAAGLKAEAGVEAVLITTLELFDETAPPKVALRSRLVSTDDPPVILWMDSAGFSGDDSPGLLQLGLIEDPSVLLRKAVGHLADSLAGRMKRGAGEITLNAQVPSQRIAGEPTQFDAFGPKRSFRDLSPPPGRERRIVVMPFLNKSSRKYAGDMLRLHFVEQFARNLAFRVVEPGVVRQGLLQMRVIMDDGPSLADLGAVSSVIDADLVVSGTVMDYHDYTGAGGVARVEFMVQGLEPARHEVVWSSISSSTGIDNVFVFDLGRVNTAHALAARMAGAIADRLAQ